jgi:hypothetical protein
MIQPIPNHERRLAYSLLKIIVSGIIVLSAGTFSSVDAKSKKPGSVVLPDTLRYDTLYFPKGSIVLSKDLIITVPKDTFWLVRSLSLTRDNILQMKQAKLFYDSVYRKFARHRMTRFLYNLAFVPPRNSLLPDTIQHIRSEYPFERYNGKIIRKIRIESFSPFGTSVIDTSIQPQTAIGRSANAIHVNTRKFVIRKNLLFKNGQLLDPGVMADNERILRNLNGIEDARIIVAPSKYSADSVDIIVVTKDVWSIGVDVITATPDKAVLRLYDGNFLGLGDRFVNSFSLERNRPSFLRYDDASYILTNIGGTFINGLAGFTQDNYGYQNFRIQLSRLFFANKTRWAGDGEFEYIRDRRNLDEPPNTTVYYHNAVIWMGYAFPFIHSPTHLVLSEGVFQRHFYSRPFVLYDTNNRYSNYIKVYTGLTISRNNYYLIDYVSELGKTENIPYGFLAQLTFGPEFIHELTRFYSGIEVAGGDFINDFGYLMGDVKLGGFLTHTSLEDVVLKSHLLFMTYLQQTVNKKYKFRTYLTGDYMLGFNRKQNNKDLADISQIIQTQPVDDLTILRGTQLLASSISTAMFTPWFFYGFRFALLGQVQGGFIGGNNKPVFATPFYSGIRGSVIVKNDNLIFPAMVFSLFFYPNTRVNGQWIRYMFDVNTGIHLPDFTVSGPRQEGLQK